MSQTICAPATASGGALGIIRVSGPQAFPIVSSICSVSCANSAANTAHYTHIIAPPSSEAFSPLRPCDAVSSSPLRPCDAVSPHQSVIDEVIVTIFRAPHSYTGEDSVEISCHGSRYILNKVLELLVQQGCRMAEPGEFTKRAYLNGKLDLSQAEAVADLIASTNRATHHLAMSQLRGHFSSELSQLRAQLLKLTSLLELELDFSDHEDLEFADRTELLQLTQTIDAHITHLAKTFETGQAMKQGIPVAIIGKTNVGKSTLLNRLLHEERAIVSNIHGTTRDTIEDTVDIHGITFRFIDTAGLRHTTDTIEQIGIERTYQAISKASIVLWLFDAPPTESELQDITARTQGRTLLPILTKSDLSPAFPSSASTPSSYAATPLQPSPTPSSYAATLSQPSFLSISAKTGEGLEGLEAAIFAAANIPEFTENDVIVTNARHYDALLRAHTSLLHVLEGLNSGLSGDFLSEDLRDVITILAEITGGQITPQETLNNIFSHFCVGK